MTAFRGHGFSLLGRKPLPAGSSDTCYSRRTRKAPEAFTSHEENWFVFSRSQRSSAPNNHHNSESKQYSTVAKYHFSEGNTRRLLEKENPLFLRAMYFKEAFLVLRESEDDETPQRARVLLE